ncbi:YodC family protein [Pseudomonas atacamensis]|uniref:YodC family protein n=1 Tax=Pseudomonas atacamensis TaxID=2565368 RepID=UPI00300F1DF1
MPEFKKGDVVELKSGGPAMTIHDLGSWDLKGVEDGAKCVWFDGSTKHEDFFELSVLKEVDPAYHGRS